MINPNTNVYPLSYSQQGIWLHQQQAREQRLGGRHSRFFELDVFCRL